MYINKISLFDNVSSFYTSDLINQKQLSVEAVNSFVVKNEIFMLSNEFREVFSQCYFKDNEEFSEFIKYTDIYDLQLIRDEHINVVKTVSLNIGDYLRENEINIDNIVYCYNGIGNNIAGSLAGAIQDVLEIKNAFSFAISDNYNASWVGALKILDALKGNSILLNLNHLLLPQKRYFHNLTLMSDSASLIHLSEKQLDSSFFKVVKNVSIYSSSLYETIHIDRIINDTLRYTKDRIISSKSLITYPNITNLMANTIVSRNLMEQSIYSICNESMSYNLINTFNITINEISKNVIESILKILAGAGYVGDKSQVSNLSVIRVFNNLIMV